MTERSQDPRAYDGGGGEDILFWMSEAGIFGFVVRTAVSALGWNWMEGRRPSSKAATPGKAMLGLATLSLTPVFSKVGRLKTGLVLRGNVGVFGDGEAVGDGGCDILLDDITEEIPD